MKISDNLRDAVVGYVWEAYANAFRAWRVPHRRVHLRRALLGRGIAEACPLTGDRIPANVRTFQDDPNLPVHVA